MLTGKLNVLAHAHRSAVNIRPSLLPPSLQQRDGEHEQGSIDPLRAERN